MRQTENKRSLRCLERAVLPLARVGLHVTLVIYSVRILVIGSGIVSVPLHVLRPDHSAVIVPIIHREPRVSPSNDVHRVIHSQNY